MKLEINIADQVEIAAAIELLNKLVAPPMTDEEADAKVTLKAAVFEPEPIAVATEIAEPEPINLVTKTAKGAAVEEHEGRLTNILEDTVIVRADETKTYTVDELREALAAFTAKNGTPAAIELLKGFGATRISSLAHEHHAAFMKAVA